MLAQAIAGTLDLDYDGMVEQPVQEGCGDDIAAEHLAPFCKAALPLEDQIARVRQQSEAAEPYFEHEVLLADDTYATSVWHMHTAFSL